MKKTDLHKIINDSWNDLILGENFYYKPEKSTNYSCWIENDKCAIEIKVERYFDKFDIGFYNLEEERMYPRSIFQIIEVLKYSKLDSYVLPVLSKINERRYFYQRFFLNRPLEKFEGFNNLIFFFKEIITTEFQEILRGDFEVFRLVREHFFSKPDYENLTKNEKLVIEKDYELYGRGPFIFPETKVENEIISGLKIKNNLAEDLKYEITNEEKEWLYSIDKSKERFGEALSIEYISSFEDIFGITLPRDYKLFLNYIGNGFYRFRTLEQSLINNENFSSTEYFEFIDLTKEFKVEKQTQKTTESGYLRIYDYGCGIVYYLIVSGENYGKIWYRNPDYGDVIEKFPDYDSWVVSFREFLKTVIGIYK